MPLISKPTALVIGAGASAPYQFPTGEALLVNLATRAHLSFGHNEQGDMSTLRRFQELHAQTRDFRKALHDASSQSIDEFLELNSRWLPLGKLLIARELIQCEQHTRLCRLDIPGHWLRDLWAQIKASPSEFPKHRLCIINFNYDRCIEHFLTNAMASTFGVAVEDAWASVQQIPILHPHGLLGGYSPSDGRSIRYSPHTRDFATECNMETVQIAANKLKLFWEKPTSADPSIADVPTQLSACDRVVFLGFGFHHSVSERLAPSTRGAKEMFSTCLGMPAPKIDQTRSLFGQAWRFWANDCQYLLREVVDLGR